MKTKLVLWGHNEKDEKILIALQLRSADNKVDIWTFPDTVATDDFARALMNEWRNDKEVPFPEQKQHLERELSVTESLLPDTIKADRTDIVQRAQTEWHFVVLSSKLNELYRSELGDLKDKVGELKAYSSDTWEELKQFWSKVQMQVKERNLLREHADALRDDTNKLFDRMKQLRNSLDEEFRQMSQGHVDKFMSKLESIEKNVLEGVRLPAIFDELKGMQRSFREIKLTREHRTKVWNRLDAAFKAVKEKRFGPSVNSESSAMERLTRRYKGLLGAIEKMKRSIDRDEDELQFQQRRIDNTDGQLEAQIRQAKINMTQERIRSKGEKYQEMLKTKEDLERRIAIQKEKDAKRKEKQEREAAKLIAKEKIAKQIQQQAEARKEDEDKLGQAADAITNPNKEASVITKIEETAASAGEVVTETVEAGKETVAEVVEKGEEIVENIADGAMDKAKMVGGVIAGAGAAALSTLKGAKDAVADKASTVTESAKETVADTKDAVADTLEAGKEKVADMASEAKETVSETVTDAKDAVVDTVAGAKETVAEVAEEAKETVTDAKDAVVDTVAGAKETVAEVAEEAKETIVDSVNSGKELLSDVKEEVGEKVEDVKDGMKKAGGAILGAGVAALSSLKGVKDAVVDKVSDLKESVAEAVEETPDALTTLEAGVDDSTSTATEDETILDKASDVMEDVAEGLSATFKAGAAAIFGAGAAAASVLSGEDTEDHATANTPAKEEQESAMDKVADVVEDITEATTSTLKNAAGTLFNLGSAAASTLSGENNVTEEASDAMTDDIAAVSEIMNDKKEENT